jgi:RimJ/RimL family protein N-acetyltransferase
MSTGELPSWSADQEESTLLVLSFLESLSVDRVIVMNHMIPLLPKMVECWKMSENMATADFIQTDRLDLISFTKENLEDVLSGRSSSIGVVALPTDWVQRSERTLRRRSAQLKEDPSSSCWLLRAMVLRETGQFVGRIGFHGKPGDNTLKEPAAVELGYAVEPTFRRQGLAEEAIRGMMAWAKERSISHFLVSIGPSNSASLQLAAKLGFKEVKRVEDEDGDGLEIVFELRT